MEPTVYCNEQIRCSFYTDDNKAGLHYYRQTPVQKNVYTVSCGFLKHDKEDQVPDSEMEAKDAKWKSIAGLALMNVYDSEKQSTKFDDLLLVADTALHCVPNISCLWRSPRGTFPIYKLNLVFDHEQGGDDFFPFSLKTSVHNEYQLIATNPVSYKIYSIESSPSYTEAVVLRIIIQKKICRPHDCTNLNEIYYCTDEDGLNVIELKQGRSI